MLNIIWFKILPHEGVSFVLEDADLLDVAERRESLLHQFLREAISESSAVHRAVCWAGLVIHLVKRERFRVHCNTYKQNVVRM